MAHTPDRIREVQRLFIHHSDVLEGFIVALLPDLAVTKDVLHEVFLTVTAKASEFQPGSDFPGWTRAIARLKILEHLRKRKGAARLVDPAVLEAVIAEAPGAEESWEPRRKALEECLEQVAPRAREILELRYSGEALSPREIAGRISWTGPAVRVALARARKFLQECSERRLSGEGA